MSEHNNFKLAFEFGTIVTSGELVKPDRIRANHSSGYNDENSFGLWGERSSLQTTYFGVKPEFFVFNNRIGIASGLRFTIASSKLLSDKDGFYWKMKENGLNTEYVRIKDLHQESYLLSVPIEIRFFPNNRELPFQHYFKIGASLNYLVDSKNQATFTNKEMEKHSVLVQSQFPQNNVFSSFLFGAVGFKIGKTKEGHWVPWGNIELHFPYLLLTDKSFAFVGKYNGDFPGIGIQLSFQIPIGNNLPIGSK